MMAAPALAAPADIPLVDYHAHIDRVVTLERAIEISKQRGVKFGILEHAGTKANKYAGLVYDDATLKAYLDKLEGKPVYKGVQAEGLDWMTCFSKKLVAKLDYVLTDALTLPDRNGVRVELWRPGVKVEDSREFMERYVAFHVEIMKREPVDILANPTFLPACLETRFDELWTPARMKAVIDAAAKYRVAIEINSRYKLPRRPFLKMARQAGVRFSFGSNWHGPEVGNIGYGLEVARELGLTRKHMFTPAAPGSKPIETRTYT
jgi:histidinol phosphatase-like PHP family hydrolase